MTTSGGPPTARYYHKAIYVAATSTMYVFGGHDGSILNDVWALNLATNSWASVTTNGGPPTGRYRTTAIYAAATNSMYIFGGKPGAGYLNDVWALNLATNSWASVTTTGGPPTARVGHTAIYDAATNTMYVFGGLDGSQLTNDVWALALPEALGQTIPPI